MEVIQDKRLWYVVAAAVIVAIAIATMWPRSKTEVLVPSPAATSAPATPPAAPASSVGPAVPPTPTTETPATTVGPAVPATPAPAPDAPKQ